jgi:hypothetical protein
MTRVDLAAGIVAMTTRRLRDFASADVEAAQPEGRSQ